MGTIVFKQELGIYPWTIHMLNSTHVKQNNTHVKQISLFKVKIWLLDIVWNGFWICHAETHGWMQKFGKFVIFVIQLLALSFWVL